MSKVNAITHELLTQVPYALKGEKVDGIFIELNAPTSREMEHVVSLKQMFYRALPKDGDKEEDDDGEGLNKLTGKDIMTLIYASQVDAYKVLLTARELFRAVGRIDGEVKLTRPLLDEVETDDLELMLGDYMLNFILASTLQNQKKT